MHHLNFFSPETEMSADIPSSTEKNLFRFFACNVVSGVESKIESKTSQSIILSLLFVGVGLFFCRSEQALSSQYCLTRKYGAPLLETSQIQSRHFRMEIMEVPRTGGPVEEKRKNI